MRGSYLLLASSTLLAACITSGALAPPTSDGQSDDPDQPNGGNLSGGTAPPVDAGAKPVVLPGSAPGIGFDDLRFSGNLAALLVPAGRSGNLDFIDPSSEEVTAVGGFSKSSSYAGDSSFGVTSADEGDDVVFATDRTAGTLTTLDGRAHTVVGAPVTLAATPGYVRFAGPVKEVWVTEPTKNQIEVFTLDAKGVTPTHAETLALAGAESLEIDGQHGLAFTNARSSTLAIDLAKHSVTHTFSNGCATAKGLAVDPTNGWILVACDEGKIVVLSETSGTVLGTASFGAGLDRVAYDGARLRLYAPAPSKLAMGIVSIDPTKGAPTVLGSVDIASDTRCVVTPGVGQIFACAPSKGELVFLADPF